MGTTAKVFLGILFFLCVVNLAVSAGLYSVKVNWHQSFDELNAQYNDAIQKWKGHKKFYNQKIDTRDTLNASQKSLIDNLETRILAKDGEINGLKNSNTDLNTTLQTQNSLLENKDNVLAQKDNLIRDLQSQNQNLTTQTQEMNAARQQAEAEKQEALAKWEAERNSAQTLQLENVRLVEQVNQNEEVIDILKSKGIDVEIIVAGIAPAMDGRIMAVDIELNLVMISIGLDDRVKPGYHFFAHRSGEYIGEIVIDKVETDAAFGHILPSSSPRNMFVQIGDRVTTQLGG